MTRTKRALASVLGWIAAIMLLVMTFLVLYQVFTRYVLDDPADFTEELVRYFLIWTGFFGAAYAFVTRQHMALVFIRDRLPAKIKRALMIAVNVLTLIFAIAIVVIGGTQLAMSGWDSPSPLLGVPRVVVYAGAPIAGLFIIVAQIINIWEDVTGIEISTTDDDREDLSPEGTGADAREADSTKADDSADTNGTTKEARS